MVRKSSAIDGPIFGRSVRTCVFERLVFDGFIRVADNAGVNAANALDCYLKIGVIARSRSTLGSADLLVWARQLIAEAFRVCEGRANLGGPFWTTNADRNNGSTFIKIFINWYSIIHREPDGVGQ